MEVRPRVKFIRANGATLRPRNSIDESIQREVSIYMCFESLDQALILFLFDNTLQ